MAGSKAFVINHLENPEIQSIFSIACPKWRPIISLGTSLNKHHSPRVYFFMIRHFLPFAVLVLIGCTEPRNDPKNADRRAGTPSETAGERVKRETREAAEAIGDLTADKRVEVQLEMEQELDELDDRMADLNRRIEAAGGRAKERLQQEWKELEPKREQARKRLGELKESSGEAWVDIRESTKAAFESLRQGVNRASSRFEAEKKEAADK